MNLSSTIALAVLLALAGGSASARLRTVTDPDAPRSLPTQGPVDVRWADPEQFSEIRYSHNRSEARRGSWVEQLALHLRERAQTRLPTGQRLEVDITDIQRAGNYEPWRGVQFADTRFVTDLYPPRITLSFRRLNADGSVIATGERKLSDPGYLMGTSVRSGSDPLRYEKQLIDRWLASELREPGR